VNLSSVQSGRTADKKQVLHFALAFEGDDDGDNAGGRSFRTTVEQRSPSYTNVTDLTDHCLLGQYR